MCLLSTLALGLAVALVGWQVAGLVEYNFGDGEVRLLAFFLMGLLLALGRFIAGADRRRHTDTASQTSGAELKAGE